MASPAHLELRVEVEVRGEGVEVVIAEVEDLEGSRSPLGQRSFRGLGLGGGGGGGRPDSAVSKPNFASKYAFESSRRDLHNALLCTALKSHFFKQLLEFCQNLRNFSEILLILLNFAKFKFCKILN